MDNLDKTFGKLTIPLLVLLTISFSAIPAQAKYGGGTGEPNDPYLIFDAKQMNAIGADSNDWDKHFLLCADIDLSTYTGTSFNIIGEYVGWQDPNNKPFTGVFDGNDNTISNFTYTSTHKNQIGLFRFVSGVIKDLGLINPAVDAGIGEQVGSLVGWLRDGTITDCHAEHGDVSGKRYAGGLVGYNLGIITNCYSASSVSGDYYVGGLVGVNGGTITYCYSTGDISGDYRVGGLVGYNYSFSTIADCYSAGSVSGDDNVGGLVGYNSGTINNCYATGNVTGAENTGGLVGSSSGHVVSSYWDIDTSGQVVSAGGEGKTNTEMKISNTFVGWGVCEEVWTINEGVDYPRLTWEVLPGEPMVGTVPLQGDGYPNSPYLIHTPEQLNVIGQFPCVWDKHFKVMADIDLSQYTGTEFNIIAILTGVFNGNGHTISNFSYTSTETNHIGLFGSIYGGEIKNLGLINAQVDAGKGNHVGSLAGYLLRDGTISNCYAEGGTVSGDDFIGGLVGDNRRATISNCYSTGSVSGVVDVGGLVGRNDFGTISDCDATGSVSGNRYVGGLLGNNSGTITNSCATASVSGADSIGGLVGLNTGTIAACYSIGSVLGDDDVGGLVGQNYFGTITDCDATGSVSGRWPVGGLVGGNWGTITNSYSESSVTGHWYVGGLVGCNYYGTISNCYATGSVSGNDVVGGLVGNNSDSIINCYSTGSVDGNDLVGGLVGWHKYGEVAGSFWDIEASGHTTSDGGTGKTTAEMQTQSTFTDAGWDFITPVWTIDEGNDYPRLWWEIVPVLHAEPEVTLGTSNIISWEPVPGANDYYAECAEDANFTSIIYNSRWITETSCEFTGLQLGRRYWYSVKARNSAGIESNWSNVESSLQGTLADAVDMMLDPDTLKNENLKNALLNKINAVQQMLDAGRYEEALNKLQNDILQKTDGCTETGHPDKNDWIITCEGQSVVYPLVIETIEHVKGLMNQ